MNIVMKLCRVLQKIKKTQYSESHKEVGFSKFYWESCGGDTLRFKK